MRQLAKGDGGEGDDRDSRGQSERDDICRLACGVKEEAAKFANIKIKDTYYHAETAAEAAQKVQQVQAANPEIGGWAMVGGWPLFTKNALDGVHEKAKVVSVDHLPEQLTYVKNGQVQALIGQDCYGWGYQSVMMLFDKAHSNKKPRR